MLEHSLGEERSIAQPYPVAPFSKAIRCRQANISAILPSTCTPWIVAHRIEYIIEWARTNHA